MAKFPTENWLQTLKDKLNNDDKYAQIARKWEGDMLVKIQPEGNLSESLIFYLDLWHGKCRDGYMVKNSSNINATIALTAPYNNYVRVIKGELDPLQALLTRKLSVQGNMALLMRNVPTVLDFVRCCREVTDSYV